MMKHIEKVAYFDNDRHEGTNVWRATNDEGTEYYFNAKTGRQFDEAHLPGYEESTVVLKVSAEGTDGSVRNVSFEGEQRMKGFEWAMLAHAAFRELAIEQPSSHVTATTRYPEEEEWYKDSFGLHTWPVMLPNQMILEDEKTLGRSGDTILEADAREVLGYAAHALKMAAVYRAPLPAISQEDHPRG